MNVGKIKLSLAPRVRVFENLVLSKILGPKKKGT
jgi:hypothetical protein